jgi:hypothetical protein
VAVDEDAHLPAQRSHVPMSDEREPLQQSTLE